VDAAGVPYCKGLVINDVVPDFGGDVPDSYYCTNDGIRGNVTIHFCGHTNGYTSGSWGIDMDKVYDSTCPNNFGCPDDWNCPSPSYLSNFDPPGLPSPYVLKDALGCCSNGAELPVTFCAIADMFDQRNSTDFVPFEWRCVQ
jgi:hypothetical protein